MTTEDDDSLMDDAPEPVYTSLDEDMLTEVAFDELARFRDHLKAFGSFPELRPVWRAMEVVVASERKPTADEQAEDDADAAADYAVPVAKKAEVRKPFPSEVVTLDIALDELFAIRGHFDRYGTYRKGRNGSIQFVLYESKLLAPVWAAIDRAIENEIDDRPLWRWLHEMRQRCRSLEFYMTHAAGYAVFRLLKFRRAADGAWHVYDIANRVSLGTVPNLPTHFENKYFLTEDAPDASSEVKLFDDLGEVFEFLLRQQRAVQEQTDPDFARYARHVAVGR